jgi:hypothetical protein
MTKFEMGRISLLGNPYQRTQEPFKPAQGARRDIFCECALFTISIYQLPRRSKDDGTYGCIPIPEAVCIMFGIPPNHRDEGKAKHDPDKDHFTADIDQYWLKICTLDLTLKARTHSRRTTSRRRD